MPDWFSSGGAFNLALVAVLSISFTMPRRSNVITGVAKTIKTHFRKHPLAIVNVKARAKGTSFQELVLKLDQATGSVLVSQEPSKVILFTRVGERERSLVVLRRIEEMQEIHQLLAAIRLECGLPSNLEEEAGMLLVSKVILGLSTLIQMFLYLMGWLRMTLIGGCSQMFSFTYAVDASPHDIIFLSLLEKKMEFEQRACSGAELIAITCKDQNRCTLVPRLEALGPPVIQSSWSLL
ncbi:hypothetical protein HHK36_000713 [Tetracentron sinense]|uniref:Uncharacterized protein n=1 Tax=Tetracentron sinense TaxID=13715 RepID=A0A835DU36_TETSI|nr:hypothetical protein HHK36_000713 [Tetracentron sinense]